MQQSRAGVRRRLRVRRKRVRTGTGRNSDGSGDVDPGRARCAAGTGFAAAGTCACHADARTRANHLDAARRLRAENVKDGEVPGAEGETFHGVILFPDDSTRRAYLYFQDAEKLRGLSLVRVFERDSRWQLDNGIAMGMTLAELVRRNGKPIQFTGLGWDYGGTVMDLHGGTLAPPADVAIHRNWRLGSVEGEYPAHAYPIGDATFSSDDPKYPQQGRLVVVDELSVSFPGEDDL
ncbi:hypothetical protein [Lysobacter fragariae]